MKDVNKFSVGVIIMSLFIVSCHLLSGPYGMLSNKEKSISNYHEINEIKSDNSDMVMDTSESNYTEKIPLDHVNNNFDVILNIVKYLKNNFVSETEIKLKFLEYLKTLKKSILKSKASNIEDLITIKSVFFLLGNLSLSKADNFDYTLSANLSVNKDNFDFFWDCFDALSIIFMCVPLAIFILSCCWVLYSKEKRSPVIWHWATSTLFALVFGITEIIYHAPSHKNICLVLDIPYTILTVAISCWILRYAIRWAVKDKEDNISDIEEDNISDIEEDNISDTEEDNISDTEEEIA